MIQLLRNNYLESLHFGSAVVIGPGNRTLMEWGDSNQMIFPRSAMKIIQTIPLLESGAASSFNLGAQRLAIACSSHQGSSFHTKIVKTWLTEIGLSEKDLKCGVQQPSDKFERQRLTDNREKPSELHNNCSGKHVGFLTFIRHKKLSFDYIDVNHPLQQKIRTVLGDLTEEGISHFGIDGCSAPNFMCSLRGLANAMYSLTDRKKLGKIRSKSVEKILLGMLSYPLLVAGNGRACSELMMATDSPVIVKTGAEGVFVALLPEKRIGVALKIWDGSMRASEAAITLILIRLGVLSKDHPVARTRLFSETKNWSGKVTGSISPTKRFWDSGKKII